LVGVAGLELFLLSKRLLRFLLASLKKASVTCFVTFAALRYRLLANEQNCAVCGKKCRLRHFLSSRLYRGHKLEWFLSFPPIKKPP